MELYINAEEVNDRAKLMMARLIARQIRKDPSVIDRARKRLLGLKSEIRPERDWWIAEWLEILSRPEREVRRFLIGRDDYACQMRNCSPFVGKDVHGLDLGDPQWRKRLWRMARRGLVIMRENRAYPVGESENATLQNGCRS